MPDPDSSPPLQAVTRAGDYPIAAPPATPSLGAVLRARIERDGPLRFPDFMAAALYDPALGYYARETRQVGRGGDFFTSVSVGPLFGAAARPAVSAGMAGIRLARPLADHRVRRARRHPRRRHSGRAVPARSAGICRARIRDPRAASAAPGGPAEDARRIPAKTALHRRDATSFSAEPAAGHRLRQRTARRACRFTSSSGTPDGWRECRVATDAERRFRLGHRPAIGDPQLLDALAALGTRFPDRLPHRSPHELPEFSRTPDPLPLLRPAAVARLRFRPPGILPSGPQIRHPANLLQTPRRGKSTRQLPAKSTSPPTSISPPSPRPRSRSVAIPLAFRNQGAWLTEIGRDWLLSLEGNPDTTALRQFQTLTHPAHLGGSFHVLELSWNQPAAPVTPPETWHRLGIDPP